MDPFGIANTALGLMATAFKAAEKFYGTPDWEKYVLAGIAICQQADVIVKDCIVNPSKYDNMTPDQIVALLTPKTWDELVAEAGSGQ